MNPARTPLPHRADRPATRPAKPRVLCLDDEPEVLEALRDNLRRRFDIATTTNGFEALRMLTEDEFAVVLSDMRMPMVNGARFLTLAREHAPDTVPVMLTGQSSLADAVTAVNEGAVFRLLLKPCETEHLATALDQAAERHAALVRQRELVASSAEATSRALLDMAAAVDPDGPARARRITQNARELAARANLAAPARALELACELSQVGAVALSAEARARLAHGTRLAREHAVELEELPKLALPFVRNVPALEPVTAILEDACGPHRPQRPGEAGTLPAAAALRIVLDYEVLERQDAPMETALQSLGRRQGRYQPELLDTFAELLRFG